MFHPEEYIFITEEDIQNKFKMYCDWCWGHGYGNCDICRERKNQYTIAFKEWFKFGYSVEDTNKLVRDSFIMS